jgi:hypothetical protein
MQPNLLLQLKRIGAHQLIHLLPILKNQERGHGPDVILVREFGELIDIHLQVIRISVLLRELDYSRRNCLVRTLSSGGGGGYLAGTAPGRVEVDYADPLGDLGLEVRCRGNEINHLAGRCTEVSCCDGFESDAKGHGDGWIYTVQVLDL